MATITDEVVKSIIDDKTITGYDKMTAVLKRIRERRTPKAN